VRAVAALISTTYARFNSREGRPQAVRAYIDSYAPEGKCEDDIHRRFARTPACYVAVVGHEVIGVVRGIENRLINLFVDGSCHRQGIGTDLVKRFERACREAGYPDVKLRASLYAAPFYEALGYKKTTGVRSFHGLKIQPMRKKLR
jgi:GNAT superfamily N-acetyltransferase